MPNSYIIRQMQKNDIPGLIALGAAIDWPMIPENWLLTLEPFPEHCMVAESNGRIIGSAVSYYYQNAGYAVISKVIVAEAWRHRGIATAIMKKLLDSYPEGTGFQLDASPNGLELYKKLGFTLSSFPHICMLHTLEFLMQPEDYVRENALPLTEADLPEILQTDFRISGTDRSAILCKDYHKAPDLAFKTMQDGRITGFCLGRRDAVYRDVSPIIAENSQEALDLFLKALASDASRAVFIDIPRCHEDFIDFMKSRSMISMMDLVRMTRGPVPEYAPENYFSLIGSNLG